MEGDSENMSNFSDLSRIFSTTFIRHILSETQTDLINALSKNFSFVNEAHRNSDYPMLFDEAYSVLLENYRCEYIYKSKIYDKINKLSKKKKKSGVLTELRSGSSIADLVWLNGTSIVYEIKTEIDTNKRLMNQINSYNKLFKETVVVSYEKNLELIINSVPKYVGLIYLDKRGKLKTFREPQEHLDDLNAHMMFMTLRRKEYESAVLEAFGYIPDVTDAHIYNECYKLFTSIPTLTAHELMVKQLKLRSTINLEGDGFSWPKSINYLIERGGLKYSEILKFRKCIQ
jgi:hypothetical protein